MAVSDAVFTEALNVRERLVRLEMAQNGTVGVVQQHENKLHTIDQLETGRQSKTEQDARKAVLDGKDGEIKQLTAEREAMRKRLDAKVLAEIAAELKAAKKAKAEAA